MRSARPAVVKVLPEPVCPKQRTVETTGAAAPPAAPAAATTSGATACSKTASVSCSAPKTRWKPKS